MPLRLVTDENGNKQCTECKIFKKDSEYGLKDGKPKRKCISCSRFLARQRVLKRIEKNSTQVFPESKICSHCNKLQRLDCFSLSKSGKFGRATKCKDCSRIFNEKYRNARNSDPEKRAKRLADNKDWYSRSTHVWKDWCLKNRAKINAREAKRRATKLRATPSWANLELIEKIYEQSRKMSIEQGVEYHVDHIVPLVSKLVCGLHCEANLQILVISKNNRFWCDMPD